MVNLFHLSSRNYLAPDSSDRFRSPILSNLLFHYFNSYPSTLFSKSGYLKFKLKNYNSTPPQKFFPREARKAHNPLDPSSHVSFSFQARASKRRVGLLQSRNFAGTRHLEKKRGERRKANGIRLRDTASPRRSRFPSFPRENFSKTFSVHSGSTEKFRYRMKNIRRIDALHA